MMVISLSAGNVAEAVKDESKPRLYCVPFKTFITKDSKELNETCGRKRVLKITLRSASTEMLRSRWE